MRSQEYNYFIVILWLCMFMSSSIYGQKLVVRQQQTRVKNKTVFKSHTKKNWISLYAFHDGLALAKNRNYKYGFIVFHESNGFIFDWNYIDGSLYDIKIIIAEDNTITANSYQYSLTEA